MTYALASGVITQTGTDELRGGSTAPTGMTKTTRGDRADFSVGTNRLNVQGTLKVFAVSARVINTSGAIFDIKAGGTFEVTGLVDGANNGNAGGEGLNWLNPTWNAGTCMLTSTTSGSPSTLIVRDATVSVGTGYLFVGPNVYASIETYGDAAWLRSANFDGNERGRLRLESANPAVNFQAKKTYCGLWINMSHPQTSLSGLTPVNIDGPEINAYNIAVAPRIEIPNYDRSYVKGTVYPNKHLTLYHSAWVLMTNNKGGTDIVIYSSTPASPRHAVAEMRKIIKPVVVDSVGNKLSDGAVYFKPVGTQTTGIRPKGATSDIVVDLDSQEATLVNGAATLSFTFALGFTSSQANLPFEYYCSGTRPGAETHDIWASRYGYTKTKTSVALYEDGESTPQFALESLPTSSKVIASAAAITGVSFNYVTKTATVTGAVSTLAMYDKYQHGLNETANRYVLDECVIDGTQARYEGWSLVVQSGGSISDADTFNSLYFEHVSIELGGAINVPYADVDGLRATAYNLDPQGFGVTWFLRWKKTSESTWTTASGTGNSTQIVVDQDVYTVQARVQGYDWKTVTFDTTLSLSLDLNLAYHVSANNTPQFTMAYDAVLEAIFDFDATANKVSVANTTSVILSPGFAELYQATQRIQHIPALVWTWTSPVTANSTSQKILIPTGNPISMFLTDASTNSVKITCPVIHADTGSSADDRVRGNPSGYSIILGSPATAESAGLANQIISGLGGADYDAGEHSLSVIKTDQDLAKAVLDLIKTAVDAIQPRTDLIPDRPAQQITLEDMQTDLSSVKATVEAIEPPDLSGIPEAVRTELEKTGSKLDKAMKAAQSAEDQTA